MTTGRINQVAALGLRPAAAKLAPRGTSGCESIFATPLRAPECLGFFGSDRPASAALAR